MSDNIRKEDLERILGVLGTEGVLDTLLCVRELDWATASEVAEHMNTHVATAVKRLTGLYEIGLLERRVRKGRTRSAQEYALMTNSFGLDIDLDYLAGIRPSGNAEPYLLLFKDMARRFAKFSGRPVEEIASDWKIQELDNADAGEIIRSIEQALELEEEEYGQLTVKSLAAASLDAVGHELADLPSQYFGVLKQ